jgi:hypothetical protein
VAPEEGVGEDCVVEVLFIGVAVVEGRVVHEAKLGAVPARRSRSDQIGSAQNMLRQEYGIHLHITELSVVIEKAATQHVASTHSLAVLPVPHVAAGDD